MSILFRTDVVVTPTIQAAAYASGDLVTPLMTISGANLRSRLQCELDAIAIYDLAAQNAALDFIFFKRQPTTTTFTLNDPLDVADAELPYVAGHVSILSTHYSSFADNSIGTRTAIGLPIVLPYGAGPDLWCAVISRGTPTYGATNALSFSFLFKQSSTG